MCIRDRVIGATGSWLTDNVRKYSLRAREVQGTDFTPGAWLNIGSNLSTIFGGVTIDKSTDAWDATALTQPQSIFTWMPNKMMVGIDQPHYVSVMGGGVVTATLYDTDGDAVDTVTIPDPGTTAGECATYFVGPQIFGASLGVSAYKVVLLMQSSEERTYYIDHVRSKKMDLVFINGFGAPECVRMYGELDEKLSIERDKVDLIRRSDSPISIGDTKQYSSRWDDGFRIRTGFITEGEARAMKLSLIHI